MVVQFTKFVLVGALATGTHATALIFFVELLGWNPVISTPAAFLVAVSVSYLGNFYWTFTARSGFAPRLPKFVFVQVVGMALNTAIMYAVYNVLHWDYRWGIVIAVIIVPICIFSLHKIWTFSERA